MVNAQPTVIDYPQTSSERAELEGFADAVDGRVSRTRVRLAMPCTASRSSRPSSGPQSGQRELMA